MTRFDPLRFLNAPTKGFLTLAAGAAELGLTRPPTNDRGHRLDPTTHALLQFGNTLRLPKTENLSTEKARAEARRQSGLVAGPPIDIPVRDRAIDTELGPLSVRIYGARGQSPGPALVYFHGGGWVICDLETHDYACRAIARSAGCTVIAVDYRLAPEHPFPAAVHDAEAAFRWVHGNAEELGIDPDRIGIGGDSAGGNLSAVASRRLRDSDGPRPCVQLLIYPGTDMTRSRASHRTLGDGYFLSEATIDWFLERYMPSSADLEDPDASPIFADDLSDLPPAMVITAGFDPLRDEGEDYAAALREAGVEVWHHSEDTLVHAFLNMAGLVPAARRANSRIHAELRRHLYRARGSENG